MASPTNRKRKSQESPSNDPRTPRKRRNTASSSALRTRLHRLVNWMTFHPPAGETREASFLDDDFGDEVKEGLAYLVTLVSAAAERNEALKEELQHWQEVRAQEEAKQQQPTASALPPASVEEQALRRDSKVTSSPPTSSPSSLPQSHALEAASPSLPSHSPLQPDTPALPLQPDTPALPPVHDHPTPLVLQGGLAEFHALLRLEYRRGFEEGYDEGLLAGREYGEEEGYAAGLAAAQAAGAVISMKAMPAGTVGVKLSRDGEIVTVSGAEAERRWVRVEEIREMGPGEFEGWVAGLSVEDVKGEIWRLVGVRERLGAENEELQAQVVALRPKLKIRLKVGRERLLGALGAKTLVVKLRVQPQSLVRIVEGEYLPYELRWGE